MEASIHNVCAPVTNTVEPPLSKQRGGVKVSWKSHLDYCSFGMPIPGRSFQLLNDSCYRFGYNGKEKLNDIYYAGRLYGYGMRDYDAGYDRFISPDVDSLQKKYPMLSPYQYASDNPIENIDIDGMEGGNSTVARRRHRPIVINDFRGKGLIVTLFGGTRGKYVRHSSFGSHANNQPNVPPAVPVARPAPPPPNNTNPTAIIPPPTPAQQGPFDVLSVQNPRGTLTVTYQPPPNASVNIRIGIINPNGTTQNVRTINNATQQGTVNYNFNLQPGQNLFINAPGGTQYNATAR